MIIEPTISVRDLRRSFGRTVALDGIDLDLRRGVTGFLGPNGAGKTTLLRILATALGPDSGTVQIMGHDPATADGRYQIRRTLGYVPQEPGFHNRFTTFEFVDYIAILKEMTDRRPRHDEVRRVLDQVGLATVMHKRIGKLSGGMRRRVAIAQALLGNPHVLVLDEPTAGLDPEQRLRFREVIGSVAEHHTVVLATHQTEDVAAMCGRVAVIDEGRVLYDGTPAGLASVAAGQVWLADHPGEGARLAWRTASGRYRVIGERPDRAEPAEPTIEDAYLLLAGERALSDEESAA
jgi:ABC-2 type transport system ATP-binding protein